MSELNLKYGPDNPQPLKELTDIKIAREGLITWTMGIYKIYFTHH